MHELSLCWALIEQVEAIARSRGANVETVHIGIGALSGVEPKLLDEAYPFACVGTTAAGSKLAIEDIPIRVRCRNCKAESRAPVNRLSCALCGTWDTEVISGDELMLLRVELSLPDAVEESRNV